LSCPFQSVLRGLSTVQVYKTTRMSVVEDKLNGRLLAILFEVPKRHLFFKNQLYVNNSIFILPKRVLNLVWSG
jgi:hypothetical protein